MRYKAIYSFASILIGCLLIHVPNLVYATEDLLAVDVKELPQLRVVLLTGYPFQNNAIPKCADLSHQKDTPLLTLINNHSFRSGFSGAQIDRDAYRLSVGLKIAANLPEISDIVQ